MGHEIEVVIASSPDREKTYAELSCDGEEWGIVSDEDGPLVLELYPRETGEAWVLNLDDALRAIQYAKHRMLGGAPEAVSPELAVRT